MASLHVRTANVLKGDPSQRIGQAYYNAVRDLFPDGGEWMSAYVDGTDFDPFNNDAALPQFLFHLQRKFDREPDPLVEQLEEIIKEFACHVAWRCEHQDRWPWEEDCMCGLLKALRDVGLSVHTAIDAPVAR